LTAASATLALNTAEWLRRGRFMLFAPWRLHCPLEQNFTYPNVLFLEATSIVLLSREHKSCGLKIKMAFAEAP
jgi:hypothetical protein